ncbi:ABC-type multidrug transport system, ATPase component [Aequorivita sublithincola DSM 14238]|uniref:ABC-type multidrug transport system, ATPase component n=1 Tax=Aequorivita sublithincola (strain DSM 14238 / LMG 21431 / ACAM 643 / 9-3) TaxID=746697 RepID=I3YRP8_AEQSU|nr:ABC transporter ATP-binding protein [Aequorivita sublithincola]AFL79666.1 ABC-type multidrug transport system, ATPase component [Aequorivita sublithincola DSM 14238]
MIEIKDLYKKFGKNEVLKGIDLSIKEGGIFSILGPNGSGKTTLIKAILGMVLPDSGEIFINDKSLKNNFKYREKIDYLPQIANFPGNLKVNELIDMIKDLRASEATKDEELIELFKLQPFLNKRLVNLSGGTKQKVNLVLTFMFDSPLIILDEPTSGLDPISHLRLKNLIFSEKEKGKTILVTSHILSFVEEIADEIVFLLEGKIYFKGTIPELKSKTEQPDFEHAIASILSASYA